MIELPKLAALASSLKRHEGMVLSPLRRGEYFKLQYRGEVVGKERPRFSKLTGATHTAPKTRAYEKKIKDKATAEFRALGCPIFRCDLAAHVVFYDVVPADWPDWMTRLALDGLIYSTKGADLDNKVKAVLDPLNGVVYHDDRQIVQTFMVRKYAQYEGFDLSLAGCGFTRHDLDNLRKMMAF